ncbi:hypothetical protein [Kibdelosporangium phytohabitans]|uniref:hypothetical protein n=1 Tax=Kibdelosporangium phytohabitans TaxID=860235 RepID=UPI0012F9DEB0|nr:hypothetical protein [Kibdelosporangium phytohabitans]MBE1467359.1 hypothetical protein [Kibdelosporangium phytohabitans]
MTEPDDERQFRQGLINDSCRVRIPSLPLRVFTLYAGDDDDENVTDDEYHDYLPADIPADERDAAHARRGAMMAAANQVVERCITDLQDVEFDDDGLPDSDLADGSFVYEEFPPRHRYAYNLAFFRNATVTAVKVAYDLANPGGEPAACTAEEIIRQAIGELALQLCELAGLEQPWLHPEEYFLEDLDFEALYEQDMDGIEEDPGLQARLGIDVSPVEHWFSPFNDTSIVHPYTETTPEEHVLHDLLARFSKASDMRALDTADVVDSPAPLTTMAPGSDVVALARQAATGTAPDLWVPNSSDPESSYTALLTACDRSDGGSGWMTWEPFADADTVRTEAVVSLTPHRHFPVGEDEPWIWAAIGRGRLLAIPLRVVVSYRPDSAVGRRWNTGADLFGPEE